MEILASNVSFVIISYWLLKILCVTMVRNKSHTPFYSPLWENRKIRGKIKRERIMKFSLLLVRFSKTCLCVDLYDSSQH